MKMKQVNENLKKKHIAGRNELSELAYHQNNKDPFYSESNMKWLQESIKQMENGQVVTKTMEELEEMEKG